MATFTELKGNIFDSQAQVLVNPVNCVGTMGAGLAKQFKTRYPQMDAHYRSLCKKGLVKTGKITLHPVHDGHTVANFPTKIHWRNPSRIEYIEEGLIALNLTLAEHGLSSVAIPAIGTGYGGLDWDLVKPMIRSLLTHDPLQVEIYLPT